MRKRTPDLTALLEQGRIHEPVPANVRARVLARARDTASAPAGSLDPTVDCAVSSSPTVGGRRWRVPFAATVTMVAGGALASAAVLTYRFGSPQSVLQSTSVAVLPRQPQPPARTLPVEPQPTRAPTPSRAARPANIRESYSAELQLLNRSQAAYAAGNLSSALELLAEHARRFPKGRLAEEREAVRIRSLAGLGLTIEARRAAVMFANRFPRSALLPRVREWVYAGRSGN